MQTANCLEPVLIFLGFLETEGGSAMVDRFRENKKREDVWYGLSTEERLRHDPGVDV